MCCNHTRFPYLNKVDMSHIYLHSICFPMLNICKLIDKSVRAIPAFGYNMYLPALIPILVIWHHTSQLPLLTFELASTKALHPMYIVTSLHSFIVSDSRGIPDQGYT